MDDQGGDGNMAVIMGTFDPSKIECGAPFAAAKSCTDIIAGMPATTTEAGFGPEHAVGVTEPLPILIRSSKSIFPCLCLYGRRKGEVLMETL